MSEAAVSADGASSGAVGARRRVQAALASAALTLVLGIVAIHVVVIAVVHRPLHDLVRIGDDHARAVAIATHIHEQLSALRRRVMTSVEAPYGSTFTAGDEVTSLGSTIAELAPLADTPTEQHALASLRAAVDACALTAGRIEGAQRGGRLAAAREDLPQFLEHAAAASEAADRIVLYDVHQVRDSARLVHGGILFALAGTSVLGLVVVGAAVILIRLARAAVERHTALLERNAGEMDAFAARAAHELRSPLHTLSLSLAVLRSNPSEKVLARAEASARRLRETIDDLLEFARAGGAPAPGGRADVAEAVGEVLVDVEAPAEAAGVVVRADIPRGLEVEIAPGQLRVVLANLVTNAVRYAGQIQGAQVEVAASPRGDEVDVVVRDTGPGIPPDAVAHVFEPFYRATTRPGGYGLGLATVKRIVEANGGTVDLASARGDGTAFTLHLPAAGHRGGAPCAPEHGRSRRSPAVTARRRRPA